MKYNIYVGLNGSFGGPDYAGTMDFKEENAKAEAEEVAYELAVDEFTSYKGLHGLRSWSDIAGEFPITDGESEEEYDSRIDDMYNEEVENWIDYKVVKTSEDDIPEDELFYLV